MHKKSFKTLGGDEHWQVVGNLEKHVIRLVRSDQPMTTAQEVDWSFVNIDAALVGLPLEKWSILLDMRLAKPAPNPEVEQALRTNRRKLCERVARIAILVGSGAGLLQVRRMVQASPDDRIRGFTEEQEAMDWVCPGGC